MNTKVADYGLEEQMLETIREAAELIKSCNRYNAVAFKKGHVPSNKYLKEAALYELKESFAHVINCIRSLEYLLEINPNEIDYMISELDRASVMRLELLESEDDEETSEDSNEKDRTTTDYNDETADWVDVLLAREYLRKIIPILKKEDDHPALIVALADTIRDYMNHRKDS